MLPPPLLWLLVATGLWLLVLLGVDSDGLLLVGGSSALLLALLVSALAVPAWAQAAAFFALGAVGYGLLRRWSARPADGGALLPAQRADQADVIGPFASDGRGRVHWQGQSWAAQNVDPNTPLLPGERVTVMGREGNCLQVMAKTSTLP